MTGTVFVVQEQPTGMWVAECIDDRCDAEWTCGGGSHSLARTGSKAVADRAATVHRKLLATMPDPAIWPPAATECGSCGQSKNAIARLQELVQELEQQVADLTGGEP